MISVIGMGDTVVKESADRIQSVSVVKGVRYQCGQPSVNLRQVPGQSNGQWCEIGKRGK